MQFFPLDAYTKEPVALMEVVPGDPAAPVIWDVYRDIIAAAEPERCHFEFVERFAFYERAKRAYAVIATGETEIYANILLKKGVDPTRRCLNRYPVILFFVGRCGASADSI